MSKSTQITGASLKLYALHATICCDFTLAGEKHSVIVDHVGKSGAPASILAANSTDVLGCLETRVDEAVESYTDPNSDMAQKLRNSANQCCGMHAALDGFTSSLADMISRAVSEAKDEDDDDEINDETETETPPVAEASTDVGDSDEEDVKEEEPEAPLTNVKFYFDIHELTEEGDLNIVTGSVLKTMVGLGDCCGDPENCQEELGCINPDGTTQTAESTPTADAGEPAIVG